MKSEEFLSRYRAGLEKVGSQEELDKWDRLVADFSAAVEAFGEENALVWLAMAFLPLCNCGMGDASVPELHADSCVINAFAKST